jgi:RNA polymerase sigma-70 factor (ECF subfamily)
MDPGRRAVLAVELNGTGRSVFRRIGPLDMSPTPRLDPSLVARLHDQSQAGKWQLSLDVFRLTLEISVAHAFPAGTPAAREVERYLASLHLSDLALASACAAGDESAWDHFVREHRPILYRAADAIDPTGGARDLADSLYAELFGLREREGVRQSLFRYFHGRSSLATWLRAVLSQRHVDRVRAGRRLEALPEDESAPGTRVEADASDPRLGRLAAVTRAALASAVAALPARDRLRLSCYYVQNLTLAAIGRLLGEHEATTSRHLARTRAAIRQGVHTRLRDEHGLNDATIAECFQTVVDEAESLDLAVLSPPAARSAERIVQVDR